MISGLKKIFFRLAPVSWLSFYHLVLAYAGGFLYGNPSKKMVVIGITGTSGKSTTIFILNHLIKGAGHKVGSLSTIAFTINDWFQLNNRKMTMLGRFQTQKFLREMVRAGCKYAIVETTSQGIDQHRHRGINYDLALCTNLYPEHIEAHGGFNNYKKAKLKLFQYLSSLPEKRIGGDFIFKSIVVNADDEHAEDFLNFSVDKKYAYTTRGNAIGRVNMVKIEDIKILQKGTEFKVGGLVFYSPLLGEHNLKNIAAAITVGSALGLSWESMKQSMDSLPSIPGRLEYVRQGQNWDIVVDYAFEPRAMESLYKTLRPLAYKRIIQILGATGGGRDKARRPILGKMAASFADIVIVTNEDPYDEDPLIIMDQVKRGVLDGGKKENENLFLVADRRQAIAKGLSLAGSGDLVVITGKGCEQAIVASGGKMIPWDDRVVVREELKAMNYIA